MRYKTREFEVNAVKYDGANADSVIQMFPECHVSGQNLMNDKGNIIPPNTVVCEMGDEGMRTFRENIFNTIFEKLEDPTYHLGDCELAGAAKLRRKSWPETSYIKNEGVCWVYYSDEVAESVYNFSSNDLSADDWIVA